MNLLGVLTAVLGTLGLLAVIALIVRLIGPGRERWGVDAEAGQWCELAFTPREHRAFCIWVHVVTNTDGESAQLTAELEAWAGESRILPLTSVGHFGTRYWSGTVDGGDEFTTRLWKTPALAPGLALRFRANIRGDATTAIRSLRVYAST